MEAVLAGEEEGIRQKGGRKQDLVARMGAVGDLHPPWIIETVVNWMVPIVVLPESNLVAKYTGIISFIQIKSLFT